MRLMNAHPETGQTFFADEEEEDYGPTSFHNDDEEKP